MEQAIGIVAVNYNTEPGIRSVLSWLRGDHRHLPCPIVVVSNSGPMADVTSEDGLTMVVSLRNVGFGRACNQGRERLQAAKYVVFVNPDIVASYEVVRELCRLLERHPDFGIIAPYTHPEAWSYQPSGGVNDIGAARNIGSMFAMRAREFDAVGGFDGGFFLWFEDADLRDRVLRAGLRVGLADGVVVAHSGGASYRTTSRATSAFLTRTWMTSHAHFRRKWKGRLNAASWLLGSAGWNLCRTVLRLGSPPGRAYVTPGEVVKFAPGLLARILLRPDLLAFDGVRFAWWPKA